VNGFGNPLSLPDYKPSIKDAVRKTRHDSELSNTDSICQKHASDVDKWSNDVVSCFSHQIWRLGYKKELPVFNLIMNLGAVAEIIVFAQNDVVLRLPTRLFLSKHSIDAFEIDAKASSRNHLQLQKVEAMQNGRGRQKDWERPSQSLK
jgi:hypothetical protein